MSLTFLKLEVANPASPQQMASVDFLIDSGAIFSVVPAAVLAALGIAPHSEQTFRLASGQTIRRPVGTALFKYGERVGGAAVVFGEELDATLLGSHTLEALGLALDPLRRELFPLPMMLA